MNREFKMLVMILALVSGLVLLVGPPLDSASRPVLTWNSATSRAELTNHLDLGSYDFYANDATFSGTVDANKNTYKVLAPVIVSTSQGTSYAADCTGSSHFRITLTGAAVTLTTTGASNGQRILWELIQDATGSREIVWSASDFTPGTDIVLDGSLYIGLTNTANKRDYVGTVYNSTLARHHIVSLVKGF